MKNKKYPTLGDLEAGKVADEDLAGVSEQLKRVAELMKDASDYIKGLQDEAKSLYDTVYDLGLPEIEDYITRNPPSSGAIAFLIFESIGRYKSGHGRKASDARHSKEGGSRDKVGAIRKLWSSGKYSNRGICAEEEYAGFGWNYTSARKALQNTPDPDPWPAKYR